MWLDRGAHGMQQGQGVLPTSSWGVKGLYKGNNAFWDLKDVYGTFLRGQSEEAFKAKDWSAHVPGRMWKRTRPHVLFKT